jgi:anthranilate synthase component 2
MNDDSINIILIDSFDSFTNNLKACIVTDKNINLEIIQYNQISDHADKIIQSDGIIISPGQGDPLSYVPYHKPFMDHYTKKPVLGVCLGHQILSLLFGGKTYNLSNPRHGRQASVKIKTDIDLFQDLPPITKAGLYHSHAVCDVGNEFIVSAVDDQNVIMGIKHKKYPIYGIQFHLESFLTPSGNSIIKSFIELCQNHLKRN